MVLRINGHDYRLVGLDTNVVSDVVRDKHGARSGFLSLFADGAHIPCFSIYSTYELRRRVEIYDQFVELFDVLPCMLLKNEEQLFEEERAAYPNPADIDPTLLAFSLFNAKRGTNLRNLMEISFRHPDTLRRESEWPSLKQELLDDWMRLRPNFAPRGKSVTMLDGVEFVRRVTEGQIRERASDWVAQMKANGVSVSPAAFPSLRMMAWTLFIRLYLAHRRPETQDVFDVLISTPAPYLDAVVTENFQAEIFGQVKRFDPAMRRLDIFTLKDLRAAGRTTS